MYFEQFYVCCPVHVSLHGSVPRVCQRSCPAMPSLQREFP